MEDDELTNGATRAFDGTFFEVPERRFWEGTTRSEAFQTYLTALEQAYRNGTRRYNMTVPLALQAASAFRRQADRLEHFAVAFARTCNWSWAAIGAELGLSRSAAQRRFAREERMRPKRS